MLPLNSVKLIDFTWARNIEILFELFISMYSINNIIYMYTIINVMLFFFSRFERVANAEQTQQGDSTLVLFLYISFCICTNVVFCLGQLLIILCFCCKFCVSNKIIVYKHSFLFLIYRDMIRYLIN